MPVATAALDQTVVIGNVSWETYEQLLAENPEAAGKRFYYDEGTLEIMVLSVGHERPNRTLAAVVEIVAEETGKDLCPAGSTTFKRKDRKKGFEPDSCFYFEGAAAVRDKDQIDLTTDAPPELVIEVDISRSSLNRFGIFAAIGVIEVWRFDGASVSMHALEGGEYVEVSDSRVLPPLTAAAATDLLAASQREPHSQWMRRVREWVRRCRGNQAGVPGEM